MTSLAYLLTKSPGAHSVRSVERRIASVWGFPVDDDLAALARARGLGPPVAPRERVLGEILLVGVSPGALFRAWLAPRATCEVPLLAQAAQSVRLAERLVVRDLPLLPPLGPYEVRVPGLELFAAEGTVRALDGESYGLGFALAAASALLGVPVPSDLVATGALTADGAVQMVEAVAEKARLVLEHALGARRLLVPRGQLHEARRALEIVARGHGLSRTWLEVFEVGSLAEAVRLAFPHPEAHLSRQLVEPQARARMAIALYRTAVFGTPLVLSWSAVEACAEACTAMLASTGDDEGESTHPRRSLRGQLEIVKAIASRHQGKPCLLPPLDEHALTPRAERLRLLAHELQAYADAPSLAPEAHVRARIAAAKAALRPAGERAPEDAVLLGAMGRAWAALGARADATNALHDAVHAWAEMHLEAESSYALAALLRLVGIDKSDLLLTVLAEHVQNLERDARSSEKSMGYVRLAYARALVQVGLPGHAEQAWALLDDAPGRAPLPHEVESARGRWQARALDALGRHSDADALRMALDSNPTADAEQRALAKLDRCLRDSVPCDELLAELRAAAPPCPASEDEARWIAERSFY